MKNPGWLLYLLGPELHQVRLFLLTVCGALALYLFSLSKGFQGSVPVLRKLFPDWRDAVYDRLDFCIVILLGSIIGTVFFVPTNPAQALAAGFGWISAVNILTAPQTAPSHPKPLTQQPATPPVQEKDIDDKAKH
jgi:uncharacterized membrane protein YbjE (DUF340 family)